jgi:hypothetical protein
MRTILHILTRPADELTQELIAGQRGLPEITVDVVDLANTPDYEALVEKIFAADTIQVS